MGAETELARLKHASDALDVAAEDSKQTARELARSELAVAKIRKDTGAFAPSSRRAKSARLKPR